MATSYRDAAISSTRTKRGTGSIRERSPGVWEIRVVVGFDAVLGRSVQRSFTVRGDSLFAEKRRRELVEDYGVTRVELTTAGARLTVGELLERFFEAPHLWKPATVVSHRPVIQALVVDPLARRHPGRCAGGHLPLAGLGCVGGDGVGAVAGAALGVVVGGQRAHSSIESAGRGQGPTSSHAPLASHRC
jgi:hypothetical protein